MLTSNIFGSTRPVVTTWKAMLETVKAEKKNYSRNANIMTPYEQQTVKAEIDRATTEAYPSVVRGIIGEWRAVVTKTQAAYKTIELASRAEITRWDAGKLNAELANAQILVNLAIAHATTPLTKQTNTDKLKAIMEEATNSGDLHKQRAVYEVIQAMDAGKLDDKANGAYIVGQARRALEALRTIPEMTQAVENVNAALAELEAKKQEVIDASQAMGAGDPTAIFSDSAFSRALKMVQFKNGEIQFHKEDDPAITGVSLEKMTENAGG